MRVFNLSIAALLLASLSCSAFSPGWTVKWWSGDHWEEERFEHRLDAMMYAAYKSSLSGFCVHVVDHRDPSFFYTDCPGPCGLEMGY